MGINQVACAPVPTEAWRDELDRESMTTVRASSSAGLTESGNAAYALLAPRRYGSWRAEGTRWVVGLVLCSVHGAAIGSRHGLGSLFGQAAGVAAGFAAMGLFAAPAFYILLAHQGHPIQPLGLAAAVARSTATTGVVLAGLAPATILVTSSTESLGAAALYAMAALAFASVLGLRRLGADLGMTLELAGPARPRGGRWVTLAFLCFSAALAVRLWWLTVPSLGGGA